MAFLAKCHPTSLVVYYYWPPICLRSPGVSIFNGEYEETQQRFSTIMGGGGWVSPKSTKGDIFGTILCNCTPKIEGVTNIPLQICTQLIKWYQIVLHKMVPNSLPRVEWQNATPTSLLLTTVLPWPHPTVCLAWYGNFDGDYQEKGQYVGSPLNHLIFIVLPSPTLREAWENPNNCVQSLRGGDTPQIC